jgi:hypothetical protein
MLIKELGGGRDTNMVVLGWGIDILLLLFAGVGWWGVSAPPTLIITSNQSHHDDGRTFSSGIK